MKTTPGDFPRAFAAAALFAILTSSAVHAMTADAGWGQWRGPANGTACLPQTLSPNLVRAWTLDMYDPQNDYSLTGNMSFRRQGTTGPNGGMEKTSLVRADDRNIYVKINNDYSGAAANPVWKLDPATGNRVWSSPGRQCEDISTARAFQLYDAPQGFRALHLAAFYRPGAWDTIDVQSRATSILQPDPHSALGTRILMGKWAWTNDKMKFYAPFGYHMGGQLRWWNGTSYELRITEPLVLIDHAWDATRCVVFVSSGFHADGSRFDQGRYMVLNGLGNVVQDVAIPDILHPMPGGPCVLDSDVVMRLAIKDHYIYALERTATSVRLVRRDLNNAFALSGVINNVPSAGCSYCMDANALYLQKTDAIEAYSLDLSRQLWRVSTPLRSIFHSTNQGFFGSLTVSQSLACNGTHLYNTTNDRLQMRRASDGVVVFEHVFSTSELAPKRQLYNYSPGDIVLMPDRVLVVSVGDSSKIWAFGANPTPNAPPTLAPQSTPTLVLYPGQMLSNPMRLASGVGPFNWQIDPSTDSALIGKVSVDAFGKVGGWTATADQVGRIFIIRVKVNGAFGSATQAFNVSVQAAPVRQTLVKFASVATNDRKDLPQFNTAIAGNYVNRTAAGPQGVVAKYSNGAYLHVGVQGSGRYFSRDESLEFVFFNTGDTSIIMSPQLSFINGNTPAECPQAYHDIFKTGAFPRSAYTLKGQAATFNGNQRIGYHKLINLALGVESGDATKLIIDRIDLIGSVNGNLTVLTASALPSANGGVPYLKYLDAAWGASPYTWKIVSGTLPAGLSLNNTGVLSGSPVLDGTKSFTVSVTDAAGAVATKAFTLTVGNGNQPPDILSQPWATLHATTPPTATMQVVAADPDAGPTALTYSWTRVSGPAGATVAFTPNNSVSSATATATFSASGTYSLRVTVSDGAAQTFADVQVHVEVTPGTSILLVDFGKTAAENVFGIANWNMLIKDVYTGYSPAGPAGMTNVIGTNYAYNFQGVKGTTARTFNAGDKIEVTWYNATTAPITFTPYISFSDADRRIMGPATGTWHLMSPVTLATGTSGTTVITLNGATAGTFRLVNVNCNFSNNKGLICDKIKWHSAVTLTSAATAEGIEAEGGLAGELAKSMNLAKMQGSVSFTSSGREMCAFSGVLPDVPALFNPQGVIVTLDLGGVPATFVLDAKGRAKSAHGSLKLGLKPFVRNKATKTIEFLGGPVAIAVKLAKGNYSSAWQDEGVSPDMTNKTVNIDVQLFLGTTHYQMKVPVNFTAKANGAKFKAQNAKETSLVIGKQEVSPILD